MLVVDSRSMIRQSSHSPVLLAHFECRGPLQLGHGFKERTDVILHTSQMYMSVLCAALATYKKTGRD